MTQEKKRTNTQPFGRTHTPSALLRKARESRRPTVALTQVDYNRVQESIYGVFKKYNYVAIDLDALVYFALQSFDVTPINYEFLYKEVRAYIIKNFAIHQGSYLRLNEVSMRKLIVCYTVEKDKE